MVSVRPAVDTDIETLCLLDHIAQQETARQEFIRQEVLAGNCFVAVINETVIGYGVLTYTFYHHGFIEMLYIHAAYRRCGAGMALL